MSRATHITQVAEETFFSGGTPEQVNVFSVACSDIFDKAVDAASPREMTINISAEDTLKGADTVITNIEFLCSTLDMLKELDASTWFELIEGKKIFTAQGKTLIFKAV